MEKIIHSLGIDWKLLIAQIINFFILFIIIYKFLSSPLMKLIEERRKKIEEGLRIREDAQALIAKIREERGEILRKANEERAMIIDEANRIKEEKLKQLKLELDSIRKDYLKKWEEEKIAMKNEFMTRLYASSPQILTNLAKKVFHREDLDETFIKNILANDKR
ncbi:MAG: hypothetical protein NZ822_02730 [Patescibacteria group bacterium]|nr:hypothetical protein [Patescibacteria group bacterium]